VKLEEENPFSEGEGILPGDEESFSSPKKIEINNNNLLLLRERRTLI